jgi:hypothetical protein
MKNKIGLIALMALALTGCNHDLGDYVEQKVDLHVDAVSQQSGDLVAHGGIRFVHTSWFTSSRTVCDTDVCGRREETRCHVENRCHPSDEVCTGEGAHRVCRSRSGEGRRVCENVNVCAPVSVPVYCQVNCRQEPVMDSVDSVTISPVTVRLHAEDGSVLNRKDIRELQLGIQTNSEFQAQMADPSRRPKELHDLMDQLDHQDRTLLLLKANNLKLLPSASLLTLPEGFRPGDAATLDVSVERAGGKNALSIVGSPAALPALHTSSN